MSVLYKCDICGHNSDNNGTIITQDVPRTITVKNYKGEEYKIFIYTLLESKKDSDLLDDFSKLNFKDKLRIVAENHINITNKFPIMCEKCKDEILKKAVSDGKVEYKKDDDSKEYIPKHQNHIETMIEIESLKEQLRELAGIEQDDEED